MLRRLAECLWNKVCMIGRYLFSFSVVSLVLLLSCSKPPPEPEPAPPPKVEPPVVAVQPPQEPQVALPCPDDMVYIKDAHLCIDRYEAPNQKGVKPFAAQTAFQAVDYCKSVGKQLCTQTQWNTACVGPKHKLYPYGNVYKRGTCNDDKTNWVPVPWLTMGTPAWDQFCKEQYKGEPSGNRPGCVSDYGVYDMTGNVAEWVVEPRNVHGYVVKGGYWYGVLQGTPTCIFVNPAHAPGFNSYEFGFRCCKAASSE